MTIETEILGEMTKLLKAVDVNIGNNLAAIKGLVTVVTSLKRRIEILEERSRPQRPPC